jgi:broad specificity phosphatase PhoE
MARVFLIRHGRPAQVWGGGGSDPGLSELGHQQAEAAAAKLQSFGGLAVTSSPMLRCRETAVPYARWRGVPPSIEPRVSEIVADCVEDRAAWLQERFPWRDRTRLRSWSMLEPRLHAWRDDMLGFVRGIHEDTAVFTHFVAINVIVGAALAREETVVCRPGYASITELAVEDNALCVIRLGEEMRVGEVR